MMFSLKTKTTKDQGDEAESLALAHLKKHGLRALERNFSSKYGEIDLIVNDGDTIVFVEVRYRKNNGFGSAAETVTEKKQEKIRLTAQYYLQKKKINESFPCRFDVIGINNSQIDWIKNAF